MKVSEAAKFVLHQTISSLTTRKTEKQTNLLESDGLFASWWTNLIWMPRPAPCCRLLKYSIPMWKNSGPTNFPSPEVQISGETWAFYIKYLHQWCCAISLQTRESPSFCSHRYIIQDTVFDQPHMHPNVKELGISLASSFLSGHFWQNLLCCTPNRWLELEMLCHHLFQI